jgi:cytidine deaminase
VSPRSASRRKRTARARVATGRRRASAARAAASDAPGESAPARRVTRQRLMAEADLARQNAYAPYSKFPVGAALLTKGGRIVHGCNVENVSFGLSICAERAAMAKAVSDGECEFVAIAVSAAPGANATPCGACRQVLLEFGPSAWVYWRDAGHHIVGRKVEELLASPFSPAELAVSVRGAVRPAMRRGAARARKAR